MAQVVVLPGPGEAERFLSAGRTSAPGAASAAAWSWLPPERVHLVLVHVGALAEGRFEAVRESLTAAARAVAPFELVGRALAPGPTPSAARRLDVVFEPVPALGELVRRLGTRLVSPERRGAGPYVPRLALARLDAPRALEDGPWELAEPLVLRATEVHLVSAAPGAPPVVLAHAPLVG